MSVAEIVDGYPTLTKDAIQGALRELAHEKEARRREDSPRRKHASQIRICDQDDFDLGS